MRGLTNQQAAERSNDPDCLKSSKINIPNTMARDIDTSKFVGPGSAKMPLSYFKGMTRCRLKEYLHGNIQYLGQGDQNCFAAAQAQEGGEDQLLDQWAGAIVRTCSGTPVHLSCVCHMPVHETVRVCGCSLKHVCMLGATVC
jgi:hypothetical protein